VRWPSPLLLVVAVFITLASGTSQSSTPTSNQGPKDLLKLAPSDDKDSYAVYSEVLRITKPDVATWTIIQETKDFTFCLKPAQNLDASYRQVIDDYALKNQKPFILERMFSLPQYTLASPERWFDRGTSRMFAILSAVGFSVDRTRSGVCYAAGTAAGNSGTCVFLVKKDGTWQNDNGYRGDACGFGGAVYY